MVPTRTLPLPPAADRSFPLALVIWAALGIALNVGLSRFTYGIMLPGVKHDLGLGYAGAGLIHAIHLGGYMVGTLVAPMLGKRLGMGALARRGHWLVAAGAVLCAVVPAGMAGGPYLLGFGRLVTGMAGGAGVVAAFVIVLAAVPAGASATVSAVVWGASGAVVLLSAAAASPLARGLDGEWRIVFWLTAAVAVWVAANTPSMAGQAAPVAAARQHSPADAAPPAVRWYFLLAAGFCFGAGYIGFATFLGSRVLDAHAGSGLLGLTWAVFGLAMIAGATLTVSVMRTKALAPYAFAGANGAGLLGAMVAASGSWHAALVGVLLVGSTVAAGPAILTSYTRQRCSAQAYARRFGYVSGAVCLGQLVGPVLTGVLTDHMGTQAVPLVAMALYAAATVFALLDRSFGVPDVDARNDRRFASGRGGR
ncbi:MAG: YbfB/YjiJ family MFS transporter [Geminicoccaceae bacterium]